MLNLKIKDCEKGNQHYITKTEYLQKNILNDLCQTQILKRAAHFLHIIALMQVGGLDETSYTRRWQRGQCFA